MGLALCESITNVARMVTIEDLYTAYFDCRKHKRRTANALAFELEYEDSLHTLLEEINKGTYEIGKSICFVVMKPKLREIFAADFRDRIVHHLVIRKLEPLFEKSFIEDTYNCRIGKGVFFGVNRLYEKVWTYTNRYTTDAYIAKFDCKGFFMSIDKTILWDKLSVFIEQNYHPDDKPEITRLAKQIVFHCPHKNCTRKSDISMWDALSKDKSLFTCGDNFGLPIGNLSSQVLANFYLNDFDHWMIEKFHGYYGRYVDDFYIIGSKEEILASIREIKRRLRELNITLHPRKFYLQHYSKGVKFTGAVVKFNRKYMNNSTVNNMRHRISELNAIEDKESHIKDAVASLNSYLGYARQFNSYALRIEVMKALSPEWGKYIYLTGSCQKVVIRNKYKKTV